MQQRNYSAGDVYKGTIIGLLSFPILMKAVIYGILKKKLKFEVTEKGKKEGMPFLSLWPYHLLIALNIIAIIIGANKILNGFDFYAILTNMFWCGYHTFILSHIYYFNKVK